MTQFAAAGVVSPWSGVWAAAKIKWKQQAPHSVTHATELIVGEYYSCFAPWVAIHPHHIKISYARTVLDGLQLLKHYLSKANARNCDCGDAVNRNFCTHDFALCVISLFWFFIILIRSHLRKPINICTKEIFCFFKPNVLYIECKIFFILMCIQK